MSISKRRLERLEDRGADGCAHCRDMAATPAIAGTDWRTGKPYRHGPKDLACEKCGRVLPQQTIVVEDVYGDDWRKLRRKDGGKN